MSKQPDVLKNLRIATPCQAAWERMTGDEQVRHCSLCSLNVFNFAAMTRDEVNALMLRTGGRVCARLYRRADGTFLTSDCPRGVRALRLRVSRLGAAAIAALLSVSAFASGGMTSEKPRFKKHGSKMTLQIERAVSPQEAMFTGVAVDETNNPLPGVSVVLRDESGQQREITISTDVNGVFTFAALNDGIYRAEIALSGFKPAVVEHLVLKRNEITRARVTMRIDTSVTVTIGILMMDPSVSNEPLSTTFPKSLIDKLPIAQ